MNKKLKKIMTDLAAGHITKEEADKQMEGRKEMIAKPKIKKVKKEVK